jgi:hypothetical protein
VRGRCGRANRRLTAGGFLRIAFAKGARPTVPTLPAWLIQVLQILTVLAASPFVSG